MSATSPAHRVLVVGAGSIGERHLRCFLATGRARASFVEVNGELRTTIAGRYPQAKAFASIAAGGGSIGITPEGTTFQYRRDGVVFRPLRDAPPIDVQMIWRRQDPHPSTHAAIALLTELYGRR